MDLESLLARAGDQLSVRRVFGEPIEKDGVLVIPVAAVVGGGGGGADPNASGGGFGGMARGIGVYAVRDGEVQFIPAVDVVLLGLAGIVLVSQITRPLRRRHRRRR